MTNLDYMCFGIKALAALNCFWDCQWGIGCYMYNVIYSSTNKLFIQLAVAYAFGFLYAKALATVLLVLGV